NNAHIYFDYNQPEVTNTVANLVSDPNYIFEIRGFENVSVKAMPNPFSDKTVIEVNGLKEKFDFSLFDVTGRLMRKVNSIETNLFEINRDALPQGIYFYRIS